jgi:VWFA-related protein
VILLDRPKSAAILAALLLAATAVVAETLTEKVEVIATEVPVHVTFKNGEPVRGLTADNFELLDNGKRQTITSFEVHDVSIEVPAERTPEATVASLSARRHIVFLFDFTFSQIGSLQRSRDAAIEVVRTQLRPTDLAGVATYSGTQGSKIVLNFTPDRAQVEQAIRALGVADGSRAIADPLALTFIEPNRMEAELPVTEGSATTRAGAAEEHLRVMQATANRADRNSRQQQVTAFAQDFMTLARLFDAVPGRKDVVYLSEGFSNDLAFASQSNAEIQQMNQSRESGEIWNIESGSRFGDASLQSDLNRMLDALKRAGCVIHAIDIGSAGAVDTESGQLNRRAGGNQGLSLMAAETGGSYTRNTNELGDAMEQVMRSTSVTYVLTFQPQGLKRDGKYHKLKVKLKNAPKGARLTHRPGYYAPTPYASKSPQERQMQIAGQLLADYAGGAIDTSVLAVPFHRAGGKVLVPVVLEIDGKGLMRDQVGDTLTAQIFAYALDEQGRIRDLFTKTVGVDLAQARPVLEQTGVKFYGTFELEPGDYRLRLLVMNAQTGLSTLQIVGLSIPAPDTSRPAVLPPMFPDPYGKWLLARQGASPGTPPRPFPFVVGESPYLPAARPVLQSGGTPLHILASNLDPTGLTANGTLRDASGAVHEVALGSLSAMATAMDGYYALSGTLDVSRIDPGEYDLSVTVRQGDAPVVSETIPVVVVR